MMIWKLVGISFALGAVAVGLPLENELAETRRELEKARFDAEQWKEGEMQQTERLKWMEERFAQCEERIRNTEGWEAIPGGE